jgi:putative zinc finger/helix-turn-helix YgiT family protein
MHCPICESDSIRVQVEDIQLDNLGLNKVTLKNVHVTYCNDCNHVSKSLPKQKLIKKELAEALCQSQRPLTGSEFTYLKNHLNYTGVQLAKILGATNVSISRWEKEEHAINAQADRCLRALVLAKANRTIQMEVLFENISNNIQKDIEIDINRYIHKDNYRFKTAYSFGSSPAWVIKKVVNS